jgi:streptomycin 6-kinase
MMAEGPGAPRDGPGASAPIPERLARTAVELRGEAGAVWVNGLPAIVADCERRWSLTVDRPFADLSFNFAAPAVRADGTDVVLKIGFPDRELLTEAEALRLFDGRGAVRLLEADLDQGALLLERLQPGEPLAALTDDEEATAIAAQVMRRLWRPVPPEHAFPSVADWGRGFARLRATCGGTSGPLPAALVDRAERLFAELVDSMAEPVLLHGDLHHMNILAAQRQPWLAIDPKGVVGEPAYETGAFLRNPMPRLLTMPRRDRVLARRVDRLAEELGFDRTRLRDWASAQAVLAGIWSWEDHGHGWDRWIACAEILDGLEI